MLVDLHRLVVRDDHKGALACTTRCELKKSFSVTARARDDLTSYPPSSIPLFYFFLVIAAGNSSREVLHTRIVAALNLDMVSAKISLRQCWSISSTSETDPPPPPPPILSLFFPSHLA